MYIKQHSSNAYSIQFRVQYSTVQLQLVQQCIQISTRINSSMYIVHTSFVSLETTFYLRVILQGFVDPIMQHGVRIEAVFASLQQGEHMVESTCFQHTPVIQTRTIILWTELFPKKRREKIQGEILQSIFEYSGVSTFLQDSFEYSVFYSVSTRNPATPSNSAYRINSSTRNTTTTRLILCRLLPATVPRVSKHSTRQNKAPGSPTAFQGHTAQAGFQ